MRASEFFFKSFWTLAVLSVALLIASWIFNVWHNSKDIIIIFGVLGGIALVIGIIASIWEN